MRMSCIRVAALASTFIAPALVCAATAWRLSGTDCAGHVDSTAWLLAAAGFALAASANPYRAFAASLTWLPLGYNLSVVPCGMVPVKTSPLFMLGWLMLAIYLVLATLIGGALLRLIVHSFTATPQRPYRPSEPEP